MADEMGSHGGAIAHAIEVGRGRNQPHQLGQVHRRRGAATIMNDCEVSKLSSIDSVMTNI